MTEKKSDRKSDSELKYKRWELDNGMLQTESIGGVQLLEIQGLRYDQQKGKGSLEGRRYRN